MGTIQDDEMGLERLMGIFANEPCSARIALNTARALNDGYLEVSYPGCPPVILWPDAQLEHQLRMRVLVAPRDVRDQLDALALLQAADDVNQQVLYFGTFSPSGLLGITLEYRLPYASGILANTITRAAELMAQGGRDAMVEVDLLLLNKTSSS